MWGAVGQLEMITNAQLATIKPTSAKRNHFGGGEGSAGTRHPAAVHRTATGAPTTKNSPAAAASGLVANAVRKSPFKKAVAARVVPQVGQGIPVSERKLHGLSWGASANQTGRKATADTAAANHRKASCRSSLDVGRVFTARRQLPRAHP